MKLLIFFSEHVFNDVKYTYAYGKENIYFMLHQKYISIQEYENSTAKNEYQYLYKKNDENNIDHEEIDIVCGEDFLNCKFIHSKYQKFIVIFLKKNYVYQ